MKTIQFRSIIVVSITMLLGVFSYAASQASDEFSARSKKLLESQLEKPFPGPDVFVWHKQDFALSAMLLNQKLQEANEGIIEACDRLLANEKCPCKCEMHWNLNLFFRIYEFFNSKSNYYPSRLSPVAEQKIIDLMWFWLESNSRLVDTDISRSQTWYIWESENHDAMNKTASWSASQILSRLPEYRNRLVKDGHPVTEHYAAWNEYFMQYLRERAIKGGLIETGSHTYAKYTLQGWCNFYDFAEDAVLKKQAQSMLDLWWTCWSLEQINGIRAGAKSRVYGQLIKPSTDCAYGMCWYYLGIGSPKGKHPGMMCLATSQYRLPDVVKEIATDIQGRGRYEFFTRKLGRNIGPVKRTDDGHLLYKLYPDRGGLVKYTYVTEGFVMGSFLQEKSFKKTGDVWSMISSQNRWSGVAFDGSKDAAIVPWAGTKKNGKWINSYNQHYSVQKNGTMIVRKTFKGASNLGEMRVYVGDDLEVRPIRDELVITISEGGYAAIKPVWGSLKRVDKNWFQLSDSKSPIIIEAACREDYDSVKAFTKKVIETKPRVDQKDDFVCYTSADGQNTFVFYLDADKLPQINGAEVDLYPDYTYKSPYLNSKWADGTIVIEKGHQKKTLDFE